MKNEVRSRIRDLAHEHGFTLAGLAAVPNDGRTPHSDRFEDWLKRGFDGPLEYVSRSASQRVLLHERYPWVKSVLSVGAFHDGRKCGKAGHDLLAHVARYARGRDYHQVFEKRLKKLAQALLSAGLCGRTHWYVDTGPVLERAWAAEAGLGWIGKNNCLIHPRHGSYLLLGELLLDIASVAPERVSNYCGTCRRCLEACPTGALVAPYMLDASRCISTWTLEMKGAAPPSGIKSCGWVAGCDICQEVCPFNGPDRLTEGDEVFAKAGWHGLALADMIQLSRQDYDEAFKASALRRTGWKGLRLNAIRVAGQMQGKGLEVALRSCLADTDPDICHAAREALDALQGDATGSPPP